MRKFRFSLQTAMGLRDRAVEVAESALRAVQEEWNENQRLQELLVEELHSEELAVREAVASVNAGDLIALDRFRSNALRRRARLAQEADGIARRLAERRAALQLAERDRTLLVRLKEKALSRWHIEYDKELQQLAEEAYLSRWRR